MHRLLAPTILLCAFALAACASPPTPTPTPTSTPPPASATATPAPPSPTAVPSSTPKPTGSPTPSPTALNVNPLTGLVVADTAVLERRPLAVKVSNYPAANVRPQSGINSADIVFEHVAEGGVTRLTGVYLSNEAARIGSARSCRILDKEILRMFQAVLACTGLSPGNVTAFRALPEFSEGRILSPSYGDGAPMFYRVDNGQPIPHNMFTDTAALWAEAARRGLNQRQQIRAWTFDPAPPPGGSPAGTVRVDYQHPESRAEWRYTAASGLWSRWQAGTPFVDALTGQQTTAANVLVVYAIHVDTLIVEDVNGAVSVEIQLWGDGELLLFRDGQVVHGRWRREDPSYLFAVQQPDGTLIPLKPGNTWVQIVYASALQTTTNSGGTWAVESMHKP